MGTSSLADKVISSKLARHMDHNRKLGAWAVACGTQREKS